MRCAQKAETTTLKSQQPDGNRREKTKKVMVKWGKEGTENTEIDELVRSNPKSERIENSEGGGEG